jgi:hypothetical protein
MLKSIKKQFLDLVDLPIKHLVTFFKSKLILMKNKYGANWKSTGLSFLTRGRS